MKIQSKKPFSKKTKTILWISIFCAIVLATVFVFVFVLLSASNDPLKLAQTAIDDAIASIGSDVENPEVKTEYLSVMDEKSEYEILKVEEKEGKTVASVVVKSPDLYSVAKKLEDSYSEYPSSEEMDKLIAAELKNAQIITTELEVVLLENESGYTALLTEDFANAYYGNIIKLKQEYLATLWAGVEK